MVAQATPHRQRKPADMTAAEWSALRTIALRDRVTPADIDQRRQADIIALLRLHGRRAADTASGVAR